jgi:hypothetical protein
MDKRQDFDQDLASVSEHVNAEVGEVLDALREKKTTRKAQVMNRPPRLAQTQIEADVSSTNGEHGVATERRTRARVPTQRTTITLDLHLAKERFTTRLPPGTKALLEEAKARQMLKRETPNDYEDITDEALWDWFRKKGYASKRHTNE